MIGFLTKNPVFLFQARRASGIVLPREYSIYAWRVEDVAHNLNPRVSAAGMLFDNSP